MFAALLTPLFGSVQAEAQGPANFVFHGGGWGHGVGMSQNGARNMATQGYDHVGILSTYYPNTAILPTAPLGDIRVHVGDATRVEMSSEGSISFLRSETIINSLASGSVTVSAHDGGLQIGSVWSPASVENPVFVSFPQPVKISNNGHSYLWGQFQLTNRNGKVRVVEALPLEKYVAGISEMPAAWPLEALMAQAIAARTYAHEITLHRRASADWAQEYDISGTTVDQNYIGWDAQDGQWDQKWTAAVSATAGVEIVDSAGPVRAYYSASNGGWTETASYVFGNDVAHTVAAPDPFDAGGHNWTEWTRTYSQSAMSRWLNAHADTSVGSLTAINVLGGAGASGRLDKATVELVGSAGTKRVSGKRLMIVMNAGIFGEGGGLDDHLPGTYTTIGNGQSAGFPQASGESVPAAVTPDPVPDSVPADGGFTPPPGWEPEPGTGVAPVTPEAADDSTTEATTTPTEGFAPPADWKPEPGTGVPPLQLEAGSASGAPSDGDADADAPVFVPPADWEPEPGTGVPPGTPTAPVSDDEDTTTVGGTGGGYTPPTGWEPEPGTGVQPASATSAPSQAGSLASAVLLVTRVEPDIDTEPAQFRVIAPTEALADEARARLQRLQTQAAVALFADFDVDGYVDAVAPRPVHGVCTATDDGITCVPLSALEAAQD